MMIITTLSSRSRKSRKKSFKNLSLYTYLNPDRHFDFFEIAQELSSTTHEAREELVKEFLSPALSCLCSKLNIFIGPHRFSLESGGSSRSD